MGQLQQIPHLSGLTRCGRYRMARILGRYEGAVVLAGIHVRTKQDVRLEVATTTAARARAQEIARGLGDLRHPNAEALLDIAEGPEQQPILVFDRRRGELLEEVLGYTRRMPPLRAVYLLRQLLAALEAYHTRRLVYGHLSPRCVLVDAAPGFEDRLTLLNGLMPSLTVSQAYAPPEQRRGAPVNPSFDLYAVGAIADEVLSGRGPWADDGAPQRRPLARRVPLCPDLAALIDAATSPEPARRPPTARAFAQQLADLDTASLARSPTPPMRSGPTGPQDDLSTLGPAGLLATLPPSVWVLTGDPTLDKTEVRAAFAGLEDVEVSFVQPEDLPEVSIATTPPWLLVFGDLHVLMKHPILTGLARDAAELSRVLVSSHRNVDVLQAAVAAGGLDGYLCFPLTPAALAEQVGRLVERTRALRFHYDDLRLALQDARQPRSAERRG